MECIEKDETITHSKAKNTKLMSSSLLSTITKSHGQETLKDDTKSSSLRLYNLWTLLQRNMVADYNCIKDKCSQSTNTSKSQAWASLMVTTLFFLWVVLIFKFVWLLNQGREKGKLHGDTRGFLDPDYREMVSQRCPKDCLHFSSKTGTHILFRDWK